MSNKQIDLLPKTIAQAIEGVELSNAHIRRNK
jgi:hypothetical protein